MTIHIVSLAALSPAAADAMRRGVEVGCGHCSGCGGFECVGESGSDEWLECLTCQGRGRVRYWDVSKGPLANPFPDLTTELCVETHYKWLTGRKKQPRHVWEAIDSALAAIQPGDVLVHDGTELGQRCAEVVARVAAERGAK